MQWRIELAFERHDRSQGMYEKIHTEISIISGVKQDRGEFGNKLS